MTTPHPNTMSRKALQVYDQYGEVAMLCYLNQRCNRVRNAPGLRDWTNQDERDDSVTREGATYSFSRTGRLTGDPEQTRQASLGLNQLPAPFKGDIPMVTWPTSQDVLDGARVDLEQDALRNLVTGRHRRIHGAEWPWTNGLPIVPQYVALAAAPSLARLAEEETRNHQGPPRQHAADNAAREAAQAVTARLPRTEAHALKQLARDWLDRLDRD